MLYSEMATHTPAYTQVQVTAMLDTYINIYNNNELFADDPKFYKTLNQEFHRRVIEELAEALGIQIFLESIATVNDKNIARTHTRYVIQ